MKALIATVLLVCSLSALGYQRMDFEWMHVAGAKRVYLDLRNLTTTGNIRRYWILAYSVPQKYGAGWLTYLRETDCESLESTILTAKQAIQQRCNVGKLLTQLAASLRTLLPGFCPPLAQPKRCPKRICSCGSIQA